MTVDDSDISLRRKPYSGRTSRTGFGDGDARGPIIDQDGREVPPESVRDGFREFRLDFGSANPFGNLSREQRLARLEAVAKLLDIAFILPGTNIRYGIDGLIGLIPVVGDIIATPLSLWLVREARAAGDAFDVLFRANMRNARLLRRWLDRQR